MSHLNQIKTPGINQHSIKNKLNNFFDVFLSFFAIAPNAPTLSYTIQSEKEARVDGTKNVF